jgi:putative ABC transport system permease protein
MRRPMFLYHLRLAIRSVRRDRGLCLPALAGLALAGSIWSTTTVIYLRIYDRGPTPAAGLHQVELGHRGGMMEAGEAGGEGGQVGRTRVSFPEYQLLAASGVAPRQTASYRAEVALGEEGSGRPGRLVTARFVDGDFFRLFGLPLGGGRFFSAEEAARGAAVLVVAQPLARALGGAPAGWRLLVDGERFEVVGETGADQPFRPAWDVAAAGELRDELYLPLAWARRLRARPLDAAFPSPVGPRFEDLLASDAVFVSFWVELPTEASRAAYAGYLAGTLGRRGVRYQLRSQVEWNAAFPFPQTDVTFFALLTLIALVGAGSNMTRLLLARGLARREELGIHRALGASRADLFGRELVTGAVLALPAACAGALLALPYLHTYSRALARGMVGWQLGPLAVLLAVGVPFLVGALATVYPAWQTSRMPPTLTVARR